MSGVLSGEENGMATTRRGFIRDLICLGGLLVLPSPFSTPARAARPPRNPAYRVLEERGELARKVEEAYGILEKCELCPRLCRVNRAAGELGFCRAPRSALVYGAHPHFGEEAPLVGRHGSGTIFFSHCNLRCVFCQNWPISHRGEGREVSDEEVAAMMLKLQSTGCHNINLVTPTHVMPNILAAVRIAARQGLQPGDGEKAL